MPATRVVCPYCHCDVADAGDGKVLGKKITLYECSGCGSILEAGQLVDSHAAEMAKQLREEEQE